MGREIKGLNGGVLRCHAVSRDGLEAAWSRSSWLSRWGREALKALEALEALGPGGAWSGAE